MDQAGEEGLGDGGQDPGQDGHQCGGWMSRKAELWKQWDTEWEWYICQVNVYHKTVLTSLDVRVYTTEWRQAWIVTMKYIQYNSQWILSFANICYAIRSNGQEQQIPQYQESQQKVSKV